MIDESDAVDSIPLVTEQIDAGKRFLQAFEKYCPVKVAFWLTIEGESQSYLYVACDQIEDRLREAYGAVLQIATEMRDPNFDAFWVKLINSDQTLAQAAFQAQCRFPGTIPTHHRRWQLDGVYAQEVYIYPLPAQVA